MPQGLGLAQLDDQLLGQLERAALLAVDFADVDARVTCWRGVLEIGDERDQRWGREPLVVQTGQGAQCSGPHGRAPRRHVGLLVPVHQPLRVAYVGQLVEAFYKGFIRLVHGVTFPLSFMNIEYRLEPNLLAVARWRIFACLLSTSPCPITLGGPHEDHTR